MKAETGDTGGFDDEPPSKMHNREPSYGGIRELFAEEEAGSRPAEEDFGTESGGKRHGREPSYGGIREMFANDDEDPDPENQATQKQEEVPQQKAWKRALLRWNYGDLHGR
eukprot:TRINITY_DN4409_c0_g1_i1.p2 TRINITY_DN4409_c0_g1~~TRINITY_DN4409_c0_g1_i1.p2  ORF type:complete len:111 (+),score=22.83 TRINITY_DN4409_c0_g1_i1:86-418(+)